MVCGSASDALNCWRCSNQIYFAIAHPLHTHIYAYRRYEELVSDRSVSHARTTISVCVCYSYSSRNSRCFRICFRILYCICVFYGKAWSAQLSKIDDHIDIQMASHFVSVVFRFWFIVNIVCPKLLRLFTSPQPTVLCGEVLV